MKRKTKRPLDFNNPTHLILRLKHNIPPLFDPRDHQLRAKFYFLAEKYDLKIYDLIFNHTHLHSAVKISARSNYVSFIRELSAWIVTHFSCVIGFKLKGIFSKKPFTRVATWGRAFKTLKNYLRKNEIESQTEQRTLNERFRTRVKGQLSFSFGVT
jgi:REP element-mobilizing transposase RayT